MYRWRESLSGDVWGGLNTAVLALPLVMAFGVESGLGASAGLAGAVVLGLVAAWLGGTPLMLSGPTGPMTVVASLIVMDEFERSPEPGAAMATIFIIFLLAGLLQVLFGLLKLGRYIQYVPYPLVSGFMNGIGLMMILFQLLPLLGYTSTIHLDEIAAGLAKLGSFFHAEALALGLLTIAIIYLVPLMTRKVQPVLVALLSVSALSLVLGLKVPTLGSLSDEWIKWHWRHLLEFDKARWNDVLLPALTLAFLGSVDTLLTSLVVDIKTGSEHKSNKELIGQGIGNFLSAVAGGIPGAGATARTMVNIRSGARTRLSAVIHSAILALALLELGLINWIPLSVLAAILITVGIGLIDFKGFRSVFKVSRNDGVVMVAVMLATVFFGLIAAFAVGIILASLFFVKKMADQNMKSESLVIVPETDLSDIEPVYLSREVHIQELSGPLFFGFASHFRDALKALPDVRAVIFRMERVPFVDQSGIYVLRETLVLLGKKDIVFLLTGLQPEVRRQLEDAQVIPQVVPVDRVFASFANAADWLQRYLKANPRKNIRKVDFRTDLQIDKINERRN